METTSTVPLIVFWVGTLVLGLLVRRRNGLSLADTLRAMVGLSVPGLQLRPWVMWSWLALALGVFTLWIVLAQACAG